MKTRIFQETLAIAVAGGLVLLALNAPAQNAADTSAAPQISPGMAEILQLSQANVSNDNIIAYIKNSGIGYTLSAAQIIYLHQHGVSDGVINTMLTQPNPTQVMAVATPAAPAPPPASASTTVTKPLYSPRQQGQMPAAQANAGMAASTSVTAPPAVTYVQTAPAPYYYPPAYAYPYYYPYPAYAWPFVPVSLSFGWGGHWGGHWGGGWHR